MHPTAKVSEEMNMACSPSNMILQLSNPYTDPKLPKHSITQHVQYDRLKA